MTANTTGATDTAPAADVQLEQIRRIVADELELEPAELVGTDGFVEVHGADSLSLIQVFARMERELKVSIPQDEMPNMVNLEATHAIVARYAAGEPTSG